MRQRISGEAVPASRVWGTGNSRDRALRWRLELDNSTAPTGQTIARCCRDWLVLARKRVASRAPRRGHRGLTSTNPLAFDATLRGLLSGLRHEPGDRSADRRPSSVGFGGHAGDANWQAMVGGDRYTGPDKAKRTTKNGAIASCIRTCGAICPRSCAAWSARILSLPVIRRQCTRGKIRAVDVGAN
jgi:hypothetical protein